jgi:hypothetical protein
MVELVGKHSQCILPCEMAVGCFQTEDRSLYVRDRQDIYWVRRFGKMIKELDVGEHRGQR